LRNTIFVILDYKRWQL